MIDNAQPPENDSSELNKILSKYVSNYNLEVLGFRQSGQQTVIQEVLAFIATETTKVNRKQGVDLIKFIFDRYAADRTPTEEQIESAIKDYELKEEK